MPTVVVDASALAAMLFGESRAEQAAAHIDGMDLAAPALIRHEIVSVAIKKHRARPGDYPMLSEGLRFYTAFRIHEHEIVPGAVFDLALATGLSAYDASYLWLARRLGVPLITLDGELEEAARA